MRHRYKSAVKSLTSGAIGNLLGQYTVGAVAGATGQTVPGPVSTAFNLQGISLLSKATKLIKL